MIALAAERGAVRVVMNSGSQMTDAHQLYYAMGFTRLTGRETRIVDVHIRPLLAFGNEMAMALVFESIADAVLTGDAPGQRLCGPAEPLQVVLHVVCRVPAHRRLAVDLLPRRGERSQRSAPD
jgi:hypothetical protein